MISVGNFFLFNVDQVAGPEVEVIQAVLNKGLVVTSTTFCCCLFEITIKDDCM